MAVRWAISSGAFSSTATWNDGGTLGIPTTGDDVFANGFTVTMDVNATVLSLNNTTSFGAVATPVMTSNTTPSPYAVTASDQTNGAAWLAFDRNATTGWLTSSGSGGLGNIIFDFSAGDTRVIKAYSIFTTSGNFQNNPRVWTFDGSNNGSTWVTLESVTLGSSIGANSVYNSAILANTTAYRYYRINITSTTAGGGVGLGELALWEANKAFISAGGSFNFNTAGVTVSATSTSASLSAGATNLITVTATGGTVTLNLGSVVSNPLGNSTQIFNHTGNCNFNLNGFRFVGGIGNTNSLCINKTSTGLITILGDVWGGSGGGSSTGLISTAGGIIINGNLNGNGAQFAVDHQGTGNVVITGNVLGGGGSGVRCLRILNASSNLTVNGNSFAGVATQTEALFISAAASVLINGDVYGSTAAVGMSTTAPTTINGNVYGGTFNGVSTTVLLTINGNVFTRGSAAGVSSTSANIINVVGDVYASTLANGISSTNASGIVNLTGNMYNTLGRNAIWCPNIFISNSATTLWRMDLGGGLTRTLYSADSFPNLPPTSDVRNLVQYGPASGLTGTMIVASPSDIRRNVLTDNTVGTANITAQDILNFINTSSDPLAVRMRTMLTDNSAGQLISEYNFV